MSSRRVDLCYLLSHGFAARMVLQTDIIPRIHEKGMTVSVVVPSHGKQAADHIRSRYGLDVYVAPDYQTAYRREYQILRRYIFEDVKANPSLWPKHHYARDKSLSRKFILDVYLLLNRLSVKSDAVRKALHRLEDAMLRSREAEEMLEKLDPDLVIATYPVSRLEATFVKEAERMGITTVGHLLSWDNITSKGRFPSPPDYYITWGPVMSEEVKDYYEKDDAFIHECGVAHFDKHLEKVDRDHLAALLAEHGLNPDRPYLFFGMSSPYIAPREMDVVNWLARQVRSDRFGEQMQLLIRPHPQEVRRDGSASLFDGVADDSGRRVAINYPEIRPDGLNWSMEESDLSRLVALLSGSSVTLNSGSTFAIDGLMHDKPVIITAFDGDAELPWYRTASRVLSFDHIQKLLAFGGCYVADSYDALARGIDRYLADPGADSEGRKAARHGECGPCDGKTARRVADALEQILQESKAGSKQTRIEEVGRAL